MNEEKERHKTGEAMEKERELLEKIHLAQDSLFSTSSGWTDYRGFFNLAFLLLVKNFLLCLKVFE